MGEKRTLARITDSGSLNANIRGYRYEVDQKHQTFYIAFYIYSDKYSHRSPSHLFHLSEIQVDEVAI